MPTKQHDDELCKKLLDEESPQDVYHGKPIVILMDSHDDKDPKTTKSFFVRSCICKCLLITFAVVLCLVLVSAAMAYAWMKDVVQHLTVEESKTFPIVPMSDAEVDYFQSRVEFFVDELRLSKVPKEDLVITQDEINGLLGQSDLLRGNMQVTLMQGKILEEYSIPTDGLPGGDGRFFLGQDYTTIDEKTKRVELKMETAATHEDWFVGPLIFAQLHFQTSDANQFHQHLLELFVDNGSFFGSPIPDDFINQHKNLLEDAYNDPDSGSDVRAIIDGIENVLVEPGQIVIKPRRRSGSEDVDKMSLDDAETDIVSEQDDVDDPPSHDVPIQTVVAVEHAKKVPSTHPKSTNLRFHANNKSKHVAVPKHMNP